MYISLHQLWRQHYITIKTNFTLHQKHNLLYKLNRNCQYSTTVDVVIDYFTIYCIGSDVEPFVWSGSAGGEMTRGSHMYTTEELDLWVNWTKAWSSFKFSEAGLKYLSGIFMKSKLMWKCFTVTRPDLSFTCTFFMFMWAGLHRLLYKNTFLQFWKHRRPDAAPRWVL